MKQKLRIMRILVIAGGVVLAVAPSSAFAHDNLGGDELAVANWMLIGAMITVVIGVLWGVWAAQSGQFNNIEESKYTMLDTAEDFDAIMAASDAREKAAKAALQEKVEQEKTGATRTAPAEPTVTSTGQKTVHI